MSTIEELRRNFNVQYYTPYGTTGERVFVRIGKSFGGQTHNFTPEEARQFYKDFGEVIDQLPKEPTAHEVFRKRVVDSPIGTVMRGGGSTFIKVNDNLWHSQQIGGHYLNTDFAPHPGDEKYYTFV